VEFRVELVIGFALLVFVGVPVLVNRLLDRLAQRRAALEAPPPLSVKDAHAPRICPYCKDAVAEGSVFIECATCTTRHHATCFEENQGCAVFGCKEKRGVGRASEHS
jgi:hypothetical protein